MTAHARLSPSGAERWMSCPGSVALEKDMADTSSVFAEEGTAAHEMAQLVLESGTADADKYIGRKAENGVEMTDDMAEHVMTYVNHIRDYAKGNELMIEQKLSIEHITFEKDAKGTSDVVILTPDELQVHDLKYGRGIQKEAENNPQLMMYALAALYEFEMLGEFKRVRLVIHQPRLNHLSEWTCTIEELKAFGETVKTAATRCNAAVIYFDTNKELHENYFNPGEEQCRFCKAKASCPQLRNLVLSTVTDTFVDVTEPVAPIVAKALDRTFDNTLLANMLSAVDLIESWCKAICSKADEELKLGHEVPGYKLVQGRMGNRAWSDTTEAEVILKSMRLKVDEMYDLKLISPTKAEAVLKEKPKCWKRIEPLITRSEGNLTVAQNSDKRPAVEVLQEQFEAVEEPLC